MNITKPLVFIDIEATGPDPSRDRIVEIALIKIPVDNLGSVDANGGVDIKKNVDISSNSYCKRVNPGIRIPAETTAIHHISNEDVKNSPYFKDIAMEVSSFLEGSDLGGFGISRFDIPILVEEFKRCGMAFLIENRAIVDSLSIYHQKERRDLAAAYQFYCQKTLVGAHGAHVDAAASLEVLLAQLDRYKDLPQDIKGLHSYCNRQDERYVDTTRRFIWRDGEAVINFSKYRGESLRSLVSRQREFVEWMTMEGKFPQEVVDICVRALRGEFPVKEKA